MHYRVLKDIIPQKNINKIIDLFNNNEHLIETHAGMNKINRPWEYSEVLSLSGIIAEHIDISKNIGDNIYKHAYPYFPHVDVDENYLSVNFLIPLYVHNNSRQDFVIFDQYVKEPIPRTWLGNLKMSDTFKKNKAHTFIHLDSNVNGCTNEEIDDAFYKEYLEHAGRDKDLFYGCTGHAVSFSPGDAIVWDSKYIHCTGKMTADYKIGLSLRFQTEYNL